jgi:hypothetical protein
MELVNQKIVYNHRNFSICLGITNMLERVGKKGKGNSIINLIGKNIGIKDKNSSKNSFENDIKPTNHTRLSNGHAYHQIHVIALV